MCNLPDDIINKIVMFSIPSYPYLNELKKAVLRKEQLKDLLTRVKVLGKHSICSYDANRDLDIEDTHLYFEINELYIK